MTDTTDTAALRVEIAELRLKIAKGYDRFIPETKIHIKLLERILDQLEAERQRADYAHKYGSERDAENESLMLTVGRLRVEIAALKAKLENPVVLGSSDVMSRNFAIKAINAAGFTVKGA